MDHVAFKILEERGITQIALNPTKIWAWSDIDSVIVEHYRQNLSKYGLSVSLVHSCLEHTVNISLFGLPSVREHFISHLENVILLAKWLRAGSVHLECNQLFDVKEMPRSLALEVAIAAFKRIATFAEKHGVLVCLQPAAESLKGEIFGSTVQELDDLIFTVQ